MRNPLSEWGELVGDALGEIRVHKLRSLLTLSGVVFGAASIVAMVSLAGGLRTMAYVDLKNMGLPRSVVPYNRSPSADMKRAVERQYTGLRLGDLDALRGIRGVESVQGLTGGDDMLVVGPGGRRSVPVIGADAGYTELRKYDVVAGRSLRPLDILNHAPVAVVGSELVRDLFGGSPPVGQTITLNGTRFRVVGVVTPVVLTFVPADFSFTARRIYVPYTWVSRYARAPGEVDRVLLTARTEDSVGPMLAATERLLQLRHGVTDFEVENEAADVRSDLAMADNILGGWNTVMFAIAGITMLVGGLGLFSVLLISVRERVREIGIRKALGADDGAILRLFLAESMTLAGLGALLGVGGGIGLILVTKAIGASFGKQFDIPVNLPAVISAVGFALLTGLVFGWYPARRAARLDPIEAISEV
ncbi:MAG TPA: ABC transporter permease [Gemmatimonadales bacterium]|nr:ABC transporter permease [Gemmatimonadales bacterium]